MTPNKDNTFTEKLGELLDSFYYLEASGDDYTKLSADVVTQIKQLIKDSLPEDKVIDEDFPIVANPYPDDPIAEGYNYYRQQAFEALGLSDD